ncbi:hypothetical protein WMI_01343 [Enterococcus faecalis EnGen0363]|uniref:replication initiation factor domain-containing protein n=1 Tax=Enterococcus faecalis TaxID=1351 RepID=UPI0003311C50|nr:replication initiation factor domain-containing protein [Enterococcus faecalis]EGO5850672.1 replication initiation factor domain-containing protein [Enterococcus faecalis]EJI7258991.1 replication initiation factor domain-containing protein [Enterococcus faecalis]EOJ55478.1 hypothetical protein WMI_01343 [Enterococcus faecalis EnGen0363]NSM73102.1 replication initiation factor domain-containing protein [Enterococcus faecalis]
MKNNEQKNVSGGYCNTPLHCTQRKPLEACIDWVSITFQGNIFSSGLLDLFYLSPSDFESKALSEGNEYDYRYRFADLITIDIRKENAQKTRRALTFVDIKGQGCRYLENHWPEQFTWIDFFNLLRSTFSIDHLTRLDTALDDYKGYLNITTLHRKLRLKQFRSTAGLRKWRYIEGGDMQSSKEIDGQTLYVGNGDVEFRFYDKKGQLENSKGVSLPEDINFWQRYEIQLRNERAENLFNKIADGNLEIGDAVRGIMCEYLTFLVENKKDTNKRRWPVCKFWTDFLSNCDSVKLTLKPLEKSVYKTKNWAENQVSVSLAILEECFSEDYLKALVVDGRKRFTKEHKQMIKLFRVDEATKVANRLAIKQALDDFKKPYLEFDYIKHSKVVSSN